MAIAAACVLATMATPYGPGIFGYLWENAQVPQVVKIAEFRPAYLPTYAPFFAYLLCSLLLMLWRPRLALWEVVVFITFGGLALRYVRFVALFFCATAPIVAARLTDAVAEYVKGPVLVGAAVWAALLLTPVPLAYRISSMSAGAKSFEPPAIFSSHAMSFIRSAGLNGLCFNSNNLGGYLIWNLYPDVRIYSDGRLQSYPADFFLRIETAYRSQSAWDRLMSGIDWAVLALQRSGALAGARRFPEREWAPIYWDDAIEIVVRRSGRFGSMAKSHEYIAFLPSTPLVPVEQWNTAGRVQLMVEARRNERENPMSYRAPAFLCLQGDRRACIRAQALLVQRPDLGREAVRFARLRKVSESRGGGQPGDAK